MSGNEAEKKIEVRIHIDRKPYESPNPTTGAALYVLGSVQAGYELFREVQGVNAGVKMHRFAGAKVHQ